MRAAEHLQAFIDRIVPVAPPERTVYLVWCYSGQVCNGGHAQFFFNSTGAFAFETVEALRVIGAPEFAALLDRMIDVFPNRAVPKDGEERERLCVNIAEQEYLEDDVNHPGRILTECDDEFFRLTDEKLMEQLLRYWKSHGEQFHAPSLPR